MRTTAIGLQILVIGGILYGAISPNYAYYKKNGATATQNSVLNGAWELDASANSASLQDSSADSEDEWRRLYLPPAGGLGVRTAGGKLLRFVSNADEKAHALHLKGWRNDHSAELSYLQRDKEHLVLTGTIDRKHVDLRYHRVNPGQFLLTTRGFHWISEDPYNL